MVPLDTSTYTIGVIDKGTSYTFQVKQTNTVTELTIMVATKLGLDPSSTRFIFGTRELEPVSLIDGEDNTMLDFEVFEGATIHTVERLEGGY